jgi:quercetin dioxygenase-like cupin family protein
MFLRPVGVPVGKLRAELRPWRRVALRPLPEVAMPNQAGNTSVQLGPLGIRFIVDAEDSNDTHTMVEVTVPAGSQMPVPHSHDAFEETFLGLDGVITLVVDADEHPLGPGDAFCVKRGQVHGFRNDTDDTVRFVGIAAPGIFGRPYFEEMAHAFTSFGDGPPDRAVLGQIMLRHGLTPAPPAG